MKAVQIQHYAKTIHTALCDIPIPKISDSEVLVRVKAAAVNPVDILILTGSVKLIQDYPKPMTLGNECAGIVEQVGRKVRDFQKGDRIYEDTLVELEDVARKAGFRVNAAVAAVAEHFIARQFAAGRPDAQDTKQLAAFGEKIQEKLSADDLSEPSLPGNRPYKKAGGAGMVPKATKECTRCGVCAAECPVQAIHKEDPTKVDDKACISCVRCITVCPQGARKVNPILLSAAGLMLKKVCSERKECELFL